MTRYVSYFAEKVPLYNLAFRYTILLKQNILLSDHIRVYKVKVYARDFISTMFLFLKECFAYVEYKRIIIKTALLNNVRGLLNKINKYLSFIITIIFFTCLQNIRDYICKYTLL